MSTAKNLAEIAADKLDRLADDIDTAETLPLDPEGHETWGRAIADRRSETAGALERLARVTQTSDGTRDRSAYAVALGVRHGDHSPATLRRWAKELREHPYAAA